MFDCFEQQNQKCSTVLPIDLCLQIPVTKYICMYVCMYVLFIITDKPAVAWQLSNKHNSNNSNKHDNVKNKSINY